jgi:heme-degrading monooxygenase HmoA
MSIIEVSTFRLSAGSDETAFLAADKQVQSELVPNRPGFLRRTTARRGAEWVVVTLWASDEAAEAGTQASEGHPAWIEFTGHLEPGSLAMHRFETLD